MGKTLWLAGIFSIVCIGTACAQSLPSLDTGESSISYTIPTLPLAPGVAPEPIGGSRAGTVLSSPVSDAASGGDGADLLIGVTSAVDVSAEGALISSQGPGRGSPGSSTSSWTVSGFGASGRASASNQRVTNNTSFATTFGQASTSLPAYSTYAPGRNIPAGQQSSADLLSGESLAAPMADSSAMSSGQQGDIPDMTMPAYSPGAGSEIPSASGFAGTGGAAESSIQTPTFSYDQYGIGAPSRTVSKPGRLASQRHLSTLHDRPSRLGSGSALKSRTRLATTKRVRDR